MKSVVFALTCVFTTFSAFSALASSVAYVIPHHTHNNSFWQNTLPVAQASAKQLGLELIVETATNQQTSYLDKIKQVVANHNPKYLVLRATSDNVIEIFDYLEQQRIHFVSFENDYSKKQQQHISIPGHKYNYWLSEISYDDIAASKNVLSTGLANINYPTVLAVSGSWDSLSLARENGVQHSCVAEDNCHLIQIVKTHWDNNRVVDQLESLQQRYSTPDIVWTVNSEVALSSSDFYQSIDRNPSILTFDWSEQVFNAIEQKQIAATVGGHFIFPALAMLNIYDFDQNSSAKNLAFGASTYQLQLDTVSQENVVWVKQAMQQANWHEFNFKALSVSSGATHTNHSAINWLKKIKPCRTRCREPIARTPKTTQIKPYLTSCNVLAARYINQFGSCQI